VRAVTDNDTDTEPEPHQWPGCPWPGWALLYAQLIRAVREMDPELIVTDFEPGSIQPSTMTSSLSPDEADAVFDRIDEAVDLAEISCVVCGGQGSGWPPLCAVHT
jgi:hypothetical protein